MQKLLIVVAACLVLSGCATVRSEDLAASRGRPVADLDRHPVFAAMPVTKPMPPMVRQYVITQIATRAQTAQAPSSLQPHPALPR